MSVVWIPQHNCETQHFGLVFCMMLASWTMQKNKAVLISSLKEQQIHFCGLAFSSPKPLFSTKICFVPELLPTRQHMIYKLYYCYGNN